MRKSIAVIFMIVGILIIASPFAWEEYQEWQRDKETAQYLEENLELQAILVNYQPDMDAPIGTPEPEETPGVIDDMELQDGSRQSQEDAGSNAESAVSEKVAYSAGQIIGVIRIPAIDLEYSIYEGISNKLLNQGIGHIPYTDGLGQYGNTGLAGHRAHRYGALFNRLDELEMDDVVVIIAGDQVYEYIVYEKLIVEPSEVSVLNRNSDFRVLTLVTCDPMINPTHRLIIHAYLPE